MEVWDLGAGFAVLVARRWKSLSPQYELAWWWKTRQGIRELGIWKPFFVGQSEGRVRWMEAALDTPDVRYEVLWDVERDLVERRPADRWIWWEDGRFSVYTESLLPGFLRGPARKVVWKLNGARTSLVRIRRGYVRWVAVSPVDYRLALEIRRRPRLPEAEIWVISEAKIHGAT